LDGHDPLFLQVDSLSFHLVQISPVTSSPGWEAQTIYESEMALFNECRERHAHIALDTADIVRDGDLSPTETIGTSRRLG
ncbi:MAG: hypothetical protein WA607_07275, partial [Candidatus Sulfotelmatobacter sp.]